MTREERATPKIATTRAMAAAVRLTVVENATAATTERGMAEKKMEMAAVGRAMTAVGRAMTAAGRVMTGQRMANTTRRPTTAMKRGMTTVKRVTPTMKKMKRVKAMMKKAKKRGIIQTTGRDRARALEVLNERQKKMILLASQWIKYGQRTMKWTDRPI